jgi:NADPH:quinone reductase-like Zn-dependent oxidoreductase
MKAARVHRFGPPEVIAIEEIATPKREDLDDNEVLVAVKAASVGPWDGWVRAGKSVLPQPLPLTPGSDLSGTIAASGNLRAFAVGQEVFGVTNPRFTGAYAEYAVAVAGMLAAKPRSASHREAAAAPVVAVTALQMLVDHAHVKPGQRVLIHGAAGSVGACAVQLARLHGARVIGTVLGPEGASYARSLGADEVIDTGATRFEDVTAPVDAVLDTVGGDLQARSFKVLAPGGVLVSSVSKPAPPEGVRASFMLVNVNTMALAQIAAHMDKGELKVRIGSVLPLAEARRAHEMLEGLAPRQPGKIVLEV